MADAEVLTTPFYNNVEDVMNEYFNSLPSSAYEYGIVKYEETVSVTTTGSQVVYGTTMLNFSSSMNYEQFLNTSAFLNKSGIVSVSNKTINVSVGVFESKLIIPLYVIIFVLSVVGNSLVLVTLAQNKRMRTVTNVYLLNLAVSDLLLGVFCMPFTLVGQVLRTFIFGAAMCKLIPYFQAVSVSVGVWTLVAISLERYFAICRPLKSRRWQTQFHAYKMIGVVWLASLLWNTPILAVSTLKAMRNRGGHKCREEWPSTASEQAYNLFLDAMLLLVPLVIMTLAYSLIMSKLWKGLRHEIKHNSTCQKQLERSNSSATVNGVTLATSSYSDSTVPSAAVRLQQQQRSVLSTTPVATNRSRGGSAHGAKAVKLWLFKGMVQVRLPTSSRKRTKSHMCNRNNSSRKKSPLIIQRCEVSPNSNGGSPVLSNHVTRSNISTQKSHQPNGHCQLSKNGSAMMNASTGTISSAGGSSNIGGSSGAAAMTSSASDTIVNNGVNVGCDDVSVPTTYTFTRHAIRSNHMDKSIEAKRKVIRMLFVVVAEFFVCWAPLHVLNTWYLFSPELVYNYVGSTGVSLVQLLAYISSCCNPITYCFMNRKFRQAFMNIFDCYRCWSVYCWWLCDESASGGDRYAGAKRRPGGIRNTMQNSEVSGNDSTLYVGRASTIGRSEVVVLEAEDRV